jgi:UDP-N-acetylglucosamine--N-acetylmuramyl-(pentapeptide) pyrophosphoryl-undecaprenol N-acetylglucosamine transferase
LILGGSQGAKALCKAAVELARSEKISGPIEIVLQSGTANLEFSEQELAKLPARHTIKIRPFIDRMDEALKSSDLVIARAGAMTVAELSIAALPTIFVPFPFAADDHQRVNARILQEDGAAHFVDETEDNFQNNLEKVIQDLMGSLEKRSKLSDRLSRWARPAAAQNISADILAKI